MPFPQQQTKTPQKVSAISMTIKVTADENGDIAPANQARITGTAVVTNTDGSTRTIQADHETMVDWLTSANVNAGVNFVDGVRTQVMAELIP